MRVCRGIQYLVTLGFIGFSFAIPAQSSFDTFTPPSGKGLVYVLQGDTRTFANVLVSVNGRLLESLPGNTYVAFVAEPGPVEISAAGAGRAATSLTVRSGETHYVSQTLGADGMPIYRELSRAEGEALAQQYRAVRAQPLSVASAGASRGTTTAESPPVSGARASAGKLGFALKTGEYKLSEGAQFWLGSASQVKTKTSGVVAISGEYEFGDGFAIEPEILRFKTSWTQTIGRSGTFDGLIVTATGKKYFSADGTLRPFIGVGAGAVVASFSGDITGSSGGAAFQGVIGAALRFNQVGVRLEYKVISAKTEDDNGNEVDLSGKGAFAGISIHF